MAPRYDAMALQRLDDVGTLESGSCVNLVLSDKDLSECVASMTDVIIKARFITGNNQKTQIQFYV